LGQSLLRGVGRDAELGRDRSRERARQTRDDVGQRGSLVELRLDGARELGVDGDRRAGRRRRGIALLAGEQRGNRAELGLEERAVAARLRSTRA
jgi:hypothetical protein